MCAEIVHGEKFTTHKSGHVGRIDMSLELTETLRNLHVERELETMQRGWNEIPPGSFVITMGKLGITTTCQKGGSIKVI
jgi:hypothetical protein